MASDRLFVVDVVRAAKMQSAAKRAPVYFYRFSYRGKHSYSEMMSWGSTENFGRYHEYSQHFVFFPLLTSQYHIHFLLYLYRLYPPLPALD